MSERPAYRVPSTRVAGPRFGRWVDSLGAGNGSGHGYPISDANGHTIGNTDPHGDRDDHGHAVAYVNGYDNGNRDHNRRSLGHQLGIALSITIYLALVALAAAALLRAGAHAVYDLDPVPLRLSLVSAGVLALPFGAAGRHRRRRPVLGAAVDARDVGPPGAGVVRDLAVIDHPVAPRHESLRARDLDVDLWAWSRTPDESKSGRSWK